MKEFTLVEELNNPKEPISETDYYQWLVQKNNQLGHYSLRREYLESLGFVVNEDVLSHEALDTLKSIHHFFYKEQFDLRRPVRVEDI